ncbi:MAG: caspase family protein [Saprospiraceae bacterium]
MTVVWAQCQGPKLYVIIISDVESPGLGTSVEQNVQLISSHTRTIAAEIGYDLNVYDFSKQRFHTDTVVKELSKIHPAHTDIVWCFYSGHGINSGRNVWPCMLMPGSKQLCVDALSTLLAKHNPKLLIMQADCCNIGALTQKNTQLAAMSISPIPDFNAPAYSSAKHLFTSYQGVIKISGSQVGQSAEYMTYSGGIFTNCFFEQLDKVCQVQHVNPDVHNWKNFLQDVSKRTAEVARAFGREQLPQMELAITRKH